VVGTDGTPQAIDAIKDGRIDFTVTLCGYTQGIQAMNILKRYFDTGQKPPATSPAKTKAITKDVVDEGEQELKQQKC
jgi:ABC-type sugar transport system substrate-binding protein